MGKVKIGIYCYMYLIADILTKVLQNCSLFSPLPQNLSFQSKHLNLIGCHGNQIQILYLLIKAPIMSRIINTMKFNTMITLIEIVWKIVTKNKNNCRQQTLPLVLYKANNNSIGCILFLHSSYTLWVHPEYCSNFNGIILPLATIEGHVLVSERWEYRPIFWINVI